MTDTVLAEQAGGSDDRARPGLRTLTSPGVARILAVGFIVVIAAFLGAAAFPSDHESYVLMQAVYTLTAVAVVVAVFVAGLRSRSVERRFWWLIAATAGCVMAGEMFYAAYVAWIDTAGPPTPSLADAFSVAGLAAFIVLLASMTRFWHASTAVKMRYAADGLALGCVVSVVLFAWVVGPWYDTLGAASVATRIAGSLYPLVGASVLWGLANGLFGARLDRWDAWERLIGSGMGLVAFGCTLYPVWLADRTWLFASNVAASFVELAWVSGLYLVLAGAVLRVADHHAPWRLGPLPVMEPSHGWFPSVVMPAIEIMAIPAFGLAAYSSHDPASRALFGAAAAAISFLLAARTGLTTIDNGRLFARAVTDPLTGLFNHRHFHERLTEGVATASRFGQDYSVIVLDIDEFTRVNAAVGHLAGDRMLVEIARRVERAVRGQDTVCRIGGDEIGILLSETGVETARSIGARILEGVGRLPSPHGRPITASIGVATYPEHASTRDELVRHADGAQYWAKYHGKNRVVVYDPEVVVALDAEARIRTRQQQAHLDSVRTLAAAVDARDSETRDHSHNVGSLALRLARDLGMDEEKAVLLQLAGTLHDVGKIGLPDSILHNPEPLTHEEWERVREHPVLGERILAATRIDEILPWVRHHHERWDGTGYPDGLAGADIPLGARVLSLCDAYDAMAFDRPYRSGMTHEAALQEIDLNLGTQFDPEVGEAFIRLVVRDRRGSR